MMKEFERFFASLTKERDLEKNKESKKIEPIKLNKKHANTKCIELYININ